MKLQEDNSNSNNDDNIPYETVDGRFKAVPVFLTASASPLDLSIPERNNHPLSSTCTRPESDEDVNSPQAAGSAAHRVHLKSTGEGRWVVGQVDARFSRLPRISAPDTSRATAAAAAAEEEEEGEEAFHPACRRDYKLETMFLCNTSAIKDWSYFLSQILPLMNKTTGLVSIDKAEAVTTVTVVTALQPDSAMSASNPPVNSNHTSGMEHVFQYSYSESDLLYTDYRTPVRDSIPLPKAVLYLVMAALVVVAVEAGRLLPKVMAAKPVNQRDAPLF
ncbi:hypothetical protein INR49_000657 [Caranx melampygus]|nr:hypothetical protein INR49_000657 [Caranx melampygus]